MTDRADAPHEPSRKALARKGWLRRLVDDVLFVVRRDRKWWLLPLIVLLMILVALLLASLAAGPLAPFLYPVL